MAPNVVEVWSEEFFATIKYGHTRPEADPQATIDLSPPVFENWRMAYGRRMLSCRYCPVALCIFGTGCTWMTPIDPSRTADKQDPQLTGLLDEGGPTPFEIEPASPVADELVVLHMMFEVERVLIPAEASADDKETIWKYVDELRIDPATSAHLARNGFRVGIANRAGLAALRSLFRRLGAIDDRTTQPVQSGHPLTLELGTIGDSEPVFAFDRESRLVGGTFSRATKYLHIDYDCSEPPRTVLRVTPEIFKESDQPDWQSQDGEIQYKKTYEGVVYNDLAVELSHGPDELLVVGPAASADSRFVVGHTFLSTEFGQRRWDVVLCITPLLYSTVGTKGFGQ